MTDPYADAVRIGLEVCGKLATAHIGSPVLVGVAEQTVVYPPLLLLPGTPVVELIVESAGVHVVTSRRGHYGVLTEPVLIRFPVVDGVPCLSGLSLDVWREAVDCALTAALAGLPAGRARTGP
jgi:hypothetical protein